MQMNHHPYGEILSRCDTAAFVTSLAIVAARPRVTMIAIQLAVSRRFGLTLNELLCRCNERRFARPRQLAMYLCRELTNRSLPQIGRAFGGRDHTTVMHACRTIERLRSEDAEIGAAVEEITAALNQGM